MAQMGGEWRCRLDSDLPLPSTLFCLFGLWSGLALWERGRVCHTTQRAVRRVICDDYQYTYIIVTVWRYSMWPLGVFP